MTKTEKKDSVMSKLRGVCARISGRGPKDFLVRVRKGRVYVTVNQEGGDAGSADCLHVFDVKQLVSAKAVDADVHIALDGGSEELRSVSIASGDPVRARAMVVAINRFLSLSPWRWIHRGAVAFLFASTLAIFGQGMANAIVQGVVLAAIEDQRMDLDRQKLEMAQRMVKELAAQNGDSSSPREFVAADRPAPVGGPLDLYRQMESEQVLRQQEAVAPQQ